VSKKTVLIVDDDRATRLGLSELLSHEGYECLAAGSLPEAQRILRVASPDLIIADVRLNDYNGLQLVINRPSHVRAIVITGFADRLLEAEAVKSGAAYLLKPVDPARLLDVIAHELHDNNARLR
jgi:DNA-binding NtrC family response regulator